MGQICATSSLAHNLDKCVRLVAGAAFGGAKVCLGSTLSCAGVWALICRASAGVVARLNPEPSFSCEIKHGYIAGLSWELGLCCITPGFIAFKTGASKR